MQKLIPAVILGAYSALLVQLLIFKNVSFTIGHLMFNFSGYTTGPANFVPFKTILPYLLLEKGLVISIFELAGNIGLFVPLGLIIPFVYRLTWQRSLILAVTIPLCIEIVQVLFRVGIFDVDDILLNGLGNMIGYGIYALVARLRNR